MDLRQRVNPARVWLNQSDSGDCWDKTLNDDPVRGYSSRITRFEKSENKLRKPV